MTLEEAQQKYPGATTFTFGDSAHLCTRLLDLVKAGQKRATSMALREVTHEGSPMPVVGRRDISLAWEGTPSLVIETTEVTIHRFCDVEENYALAEGENNTLEGWRNDHQAYFERNGGFDPEMELVCERFTLIEVF